MKIIISGGENNVV